MSQNVKNLTYELTYYDSKVVLELLTKEDARLAALCKTLTDEDEVADATNDLLAVRSLLRRMSSQAVEEYGKSVMNFDKTPI